MELRDYPPPEIEREIAQVEMMLQSVEDRRSVLLAKLKKLLQALPPDHPKRLANKTTKSAGGKKHHA